MLVVYKEAGMGVGVWKESKKVNLACVKTPCVVVPIMIPALASAESGLRVFGLLVRGHCEASKFEDGRTRHANGCDRERLQKWNRSGSLGRDGSQIKQTA